MTLLITTFAPWKAHQTTNSSDELVTLVRDRHRLAPGTQFVRNLPVHFQLAPAQVLSAIYQHRPTTVICCGMAEQRSRLNLERYARRAGDRLETSLDLLQLTAGLEWSKISHDAGTFVCNALYYELLDHIRQNNLAVQTLFVHIPPLTDYNRQPLLQDFVSVLSRLPSTAALTRRSAA
jgi:pyroglutamyl-peptidase